MNRVYKAELLHENILYLCKIRNIKIGKMLRNIKGIYQPDDQWTHCTKCRLCCGMF